MMLENKSVEQKLYKAGIKRIEGLKYSQDKVKEAIKYLKRQQEIGYRYRLGIIGVEKFIKKSLNIDENACDIEAEMIQDELLAVAGLSAFLNAMVDETMIDDIEEIDLDDIDTYDMRCILKAAMKNINEGWL